MSIAKHKQSQQNQKDHHPQEQAHQQQKTHQKQNSKKSSQAIASLHEQELPETRSFR